MNYWAASVFFPKGGEKLIAVFFIAAIAILITFKFNKIQKNRYFEVIAFLISIPPAILIGEGVVEEFFLVSSAWFLIVIEITNSAIEAIIKCIIPKEDEISLRAKYLGSVSVFIIICISGIIWAVIGFKNILLD